MYYEIIYLSEQKFLKPCLISASKLDVSVVPPFNVQNVIPNMPEIWMRKCNQEKKMLNQPSDLSERNKYFNSLIMLITDIKND